MNTKEEQPMKSVDPNQAGGVSNQASPMQTQRPSLDKDIFRVEANLDRLKKLKELREAARPLMEYLRMVYGPYTVATVDCGSVKITREIQMVLLD